MKTLGQIAYEAYWKDYERHWNDWNDNTIEQKDGWEDSAKAVASAYRAANPPAAVRVLTRHDIQAAEWKRHIVQHLPASCDELAEELNFRLSTPPAAQAGEGQQHGKEERS